MILDLCDNMEISGIVDTKSATAGPWQSCNVTKTCSQRVDFVFQWPHVERQKPSN